MIVVPPLVHRMGIIILYLSFTKNTQEDKVSSLCTKTWRLSWFVVGIGHSLTTQTNQTIRSDFLFLSIR